MREMASAELGELVRGYRGPLTVITGNCAANLANCGSIARRIIFPS